MSGEKKQADAVGQLSNEKNFLSWLRICIIMIASGLVVLRLPLFMQQVFRLPVRGTVTNMSNYSQIVAVIFIATGLSVAILSYIRYKLNEKRLEELPLEYSSLLFPVITALFFLGSIFLIAYPI